MACSQVYQRPALSTCGKVPAALENTKTHLRTPCASSPPPRSRHLYCFFAVRITSSHRTMSTARHCTWSAWDPGCKV